VLVSHALTAHESVGADRREQVTRRAQAQRSLASVAPLGYVLLVLLVAYLLVENTATLVAVVGTVLAAALAAVAVRLSLRRGAAARRWLADPLPPD
jgi:TRAP-type mannitol/chloroaromatic compound transport system permease large subunit